MNDTNDTEQRIDFGPGATQSVPPDWASSMLTWIYANKPDVFRGALEQALGIAKPAPKSRAAASEFAQTITLPTGRHAETG